jgi:hypothetical protein
MAGPKLVTLTKILASRVQEAEDAFEGLANLLVLSLLSGVHLRDFVSRAGVFPMSGDDDDRLKVRFRAQVLINTCRNPSKDAVMRVLHLLLPTNTFEVVSSNLESEVDIYVLEPVPSAEWGLQATQALRGMAPAGANAQLHYRLAGPYFAWEEDTSADAAGFDNGPLWAPSPGL